MKISEVIALLEKYQQTYGDLQVVLPHRGGVNVAWETLNYIDVGKFKYIVYSTDEVIHDKVVTLE